MHYTGTIWRPPYEADSLLIQATAGCTHHRCRFCTLNEDVPFRFRPSPLEEIEADLLEAQTWVHDPIAKQVARLFDRPQPRVDRVFLTGSNPFALKADRLLEIAGLVAEYFPQVASIGCFSRVDDVGRKADDDLGRLRAAGFDSLTIGVETGDDEALAFMDKGYTAADIVRQLGRLDAAGISYNVFYLVGISGRGARRGGGAPDGGGAQLNAPAHHRGEHAHRVPQLAARGRRRGRPLGGGDGDREIPRGARAREPAHRRGGLRHGRRLERRVRGGTAAGAAASDTRRA